MTHEEWLERGEFYALGALDEDERRQMEAHLASGCDICEAHIQQIRETLAHLPRSLTPQAPPPAVRAKLLETLGHPSTHAQPEDRRSARSWWSIGTGALAAAVLLSLLAWNFFTTRRELVELRREIAALQSQADRRDDIVQLLTDRRVRVILLAGLPASPAASGRLLWNSETHEGILLTTGLPPTAVGKEYELWGLAGNQPVPAGVFKVDQQGRALLRLPPFPTGARFDKFAVTLEPAGGVPKPTGPMHLLGSL